MTETELCPNCQRPPSERVARAPYTGGHGEPAVTTERCNGPVHDIADHTPTLYRLLLANAGHWRSYFEARQSLDAAPIDSEELRRLAGVARQEEAFLRSLMERATSTCLGCQGGSVHHTCGRSPRA